MAEEETFKVNTGDDEKSVEVEQDENDGVVLDTSTGQGMENMEIPEGMRAPAFEGGKKVKIFMNEKYGFPHFPTPYQLKCQERYHHLLLQHL